MIRILGTSHVSSESMKKIDKELEGKIDAICVELDPVRYYSLKTGERKSPRGIFMKLLYHLQNYLGRVAGMMPGQEMLYAILLAQKKSIPAYLIDRNISATVNDLKRIPLTEKLKLFMPTLIRGKLDLKKIPSEKLVKESLKHLKERAPNIYKILIDDRNDFMRKWVDAISNSHENLLVVVGAGHVEGLEKLLKESSKKVKRV